MQESEVSTSSCPVTGLGSASVARSLDPFGPEYRTNPFTVFKSARDGAPAYYSEEIGYWILTRYDDIKQVIRDTTNFSADLVNAPLVPYDDEALEELAKVGFRGLKVLGDCDPPDHVRVRRQVNKAFNAKRIALMEEPIRELARQHIDRFAGEQEVEFVSALAWPLPARVLFRLFGMPDSNLEAVKNGSADRVVVNHGRPEPGDSRRAAQGLAGFYALCRKLIVERLDDLRDDFPSDLIRAGEGLDNPLNTDELVQVMYSMLFAGHETTTAHLAHLVRLAVNEPGLWQRMRADRELIPKVVEEALRLEAPVINWRRRAKHEVEVAGIRLPADAKVLLLLGSANRDERHFDDPDELMPERPNARTNLTFGFGEHMCVGAPLARLEGQIVLEELVDRFPSPGLPEGPGVDFAANLIFRSPKRLQMSL